jgi:hypothetical protein
LKRDFEHPSEDRRGVLSLPSNAENVNRTVRFEGLNKENVERSRKRRGQVAIGWNYTFQKFVGSAPQIEGARVAFNYAPHKLLWCRFTTHEGLLNEQSVTAKNGRKGRSLNTLPVVFRCAKSSIPASGGIGWRPRATMPVKEQVGRLIEHQRNDGPHNRRSSRAIRFCPPEPR